MSMHYAPLVEQFQVSKGIALLISTSRHKKLRQFIEKNVTYI